jgi:hypothetical protein
MTRWDGAPAGEELDSELVASSCRDALLWEDGHLPFATQPGGRPSRAPRVAPNDLFVSHRQGVDGRPAPRTAVAPESESS